jgi:hypothetical protein
MRAPADAANRQAKKRKQARSVRKSTIWWLMAGSAVAVELVTGTFYLLMLAIGLASAALAAHLGASITLQFLSAAVVGGGAIVGWHLLRGRRPQGPGSAANPAPATWMWVKPSRWITGKPTAPPGASTAAPTGPFSTAPA